MRVPGIRPLMISCLMAFGLWGCSQSDLERLTLTGSSTIAPLAAELAREFELLHPGVRA